MINETPKSKRWIWWVVGGLAVILCCCCLLAVIAASMFMSRIEMPAIDNPPVLPSLDDSTGPGFFDDLLPTATPDAAGEDEPVNGPTREPGSSLPAPASSDFQTEQELQSVIVPARDLRTLAERLRGVGSIPEVVKSNTPLYREGQEETFWVSNEDEQQHKQIDAKLVYMNDVLYMWVENGVRYDLGDIKKSADRFADEIYPTTRNFFGSEWSPGVDSDPRLHILHSEELGSGIAGYFSGADEVSNKAQPYSNEREMFYINIGNTEPNTEFYDSVLAHEFQHMIHWYQDKNESSWVNEGLSELSMELNGFSTDGADMVFSDLPDTQLNAWSDDPNGRTEHYGASYLFMSYFLQRFGNTMMQSVVADDANDIVGFDDTLKDVTLTFDQVFADWVVANFLDDASLADGQYGYKNYDPFTMSKDATHRRFPVQRESDVHQYATDYIEIKASGTATVDFRGATTTRLAANEPHSGSHAWWGNRVDDSDSRLTQAFDLSGVKKATLKFWTWYDIEDDWDYAYVMASIDGGKTWETLKTEDAVDTNPNGNSFGWALTGCSGDPTSTQAGDDCNAKWIEQSADLSDFAGAKEVLVRFEYITDDAVNYPGFFVDDVSISEINFADDMETEGGWVSDGWLRTDNILRQRWLVQMIEMTDGQDPLITRIPVDESGVAQWTINDLSDNTTLVMAVSALAPITTESAPYEYLITEQ